MGGRDTSRPARNTGGTLRTPADGLCPGHTVGLYSGLMPSLQLEEKSLEESSDAPRHPLLLGDPGAEVLEDDGGCPTADPHLYLHALFLWHALAHLRSLLESLTSPPQVCQQVLSRCHILNPVLLVQDESGGRRSSETGHEHRQMRAGSKHDARSHAKRSGAGTRQSCKMQD